MDSLCFITVLGFLGILLVPPSAWLIPVEFLCILIPASLAALRIDKPTWPGAVLPLFAFFLALRVTKGWVEAVMVLGG